MTKKKEDKLVEITRATYIRIMLDTADKYEEELSLLEQKNSLHVMNYNRKRRTLENRYVEIFKTLRNLDMLSETHGICYYHTSEQEITYTLEEKPTAGFGK